ncbi:hypothetical protein [Natrinema thermotolerans]|uniref:hypothetical protein n=1 Tax=Natrinema TaxID=88723 RepID=UPI0009FD1964|nr:hypothetical protein DVR14_19110 [Natrinema thermotolerans]QCC61517.1 hypothetical protein DVR14_23240 [Natrinema thermotolerans]
MNLTRLLKPLVRDTGVIGGVTVGLVYGLTHSGAVIVGLAGLGILCIGVGGGTTGHGGTSGFAALGRTGHDESSEVRNMTRHMELWPGVSSDMPVRVRLLFYGLGLLFWSLTVLGLFSSRLH